MRNGLFVGGCLTLSVLFAGIVSAITASPAVLGVTPVGIAIYLTVGVGLPQYLLSRRSSSRLQLGLAGLAVAGGAVVLIGGVATGSPNAEWSGGIVAILLVLVLVLGNALGAGVREFRAGYQSTS
ncbi:hypothetical protein [Natrinema sp. 1APR25-10V2]|uniref:hypothetical protein n=1 Tax=Natrinema sp. 1APR25-10V2 TaxID=2951081 RepID=UPI002876A09F|nr:hypothetical protein [Natrinema sp. 1APR25-10V2]MDS0474905.1 hypothetical protein [Natrinema sp. 1APR25-10V2]